VDPEVEALYGLPLEDFTKARDALARDRKKAGDAEGAAQIKALRKPSVVAWGLNQLARRHPDDVDQLLKAGDRLRQAQAATLEGGDPAELRSASRAEGAEVNALAGQARSILAEAGRAASPTQEDRLATTLRAAAVDPAAGEQLRRGVLAVELSPAGFGFGAGTDDLEAALSASVRRPKADRKGEATQAQADAEAEVDAQRRAEERRRAKEREAELRQAEREAARLGRAADEAEEQARMARQAADDATRKVDELRESREPPPEMSKGRKG
jgi:hypothetical protein